MVPKARLTARANGAALSMATNTPESSKVVISRQLSPIRVPSAP